MKDIVMCEYGYSGDYESLVETAFHVLKHGVGGSYQGVGILIVTDGLNEGVLEYSYGSCSGCDGLHACYTKADVEELRAELVADIKWGNVKEILNAQLSEEYVYDDFKEAVRELGYPMDNGRLI